MRAKLLFTAGALLLAAVPASASDKSDALNTVDQAVQAFNKADMDAFTAMCAANPVIIDSMMPNVWQGANACADWWKAFDDGSKKQGMTDGVVSHGKPVHFDLMGDRAYVVFPGVYKFKMKGKSMTDKGAWAFSLQKVAAGWRIAGWSWAGQ